MPRPSNLRGRPAGVKNKVGRDIKEMVVGALAGVGGTEYLMRQAEQNPVAFMGLVGRVLPLQVTGENGAPIAVDFRWADATPPTIDADETILVADETEITVTFLDVDTANTNVDTDVGEC